MHLSPFSSNRTTEGNGTVPVTDMSVDMTPFLNGIAEVQDEGLRKDAEEKPPIYQQPYQTYSTPSDQQYADKNKSYSTSTLKKNQHSTSTLDKKQKDLRVRSNGSTYSTGNRTLQITSK